MREEEFKDWLESILGRDDKPLDDRTIKACLSYCRALERHDYDLDDCYESDGMQGLLYKLTYSTEDERTNAKPRHRVEIGGESPKKRTDNLKWAATRYKRFREESDVPESAIAPARTDTKEPLNQILCGPPGTGKTYEAFSIALKITGDDQSDYREWAKAGAMQEGGQVDFITFHQSYTYEDFIEGIRPVLDGQRLRYELRDGVFKRISQRASENPGEPYVLIIDEINRGNVAKIFGELITLIEPSKREDGEDAAKVTLPYSQTRFSVPDNLHLVGTMNTADRGIALLDTALRRRFEFVERMPDATLLDRNVEGVNCQDLLGAINERIVELLDRERQIGHTYFMGVETLEELADAFRKQVVPLLQEYFYDDWEKLRRVLNNNAFIEKRKGRVLDQDVFEVLPADDARWKQAESYQDIYDDDRDETDRE